MKGSRFLPHRSLHFARGREHGPPQADGLGQRTSRWGRGGYLLIRPTPADTASPGAVFLPVSPARLLRLCLVVAVLSALMGQPLPVASAASAPPPAAPASDLLSFAAGGHVLGFGAGGVFVASGSHLLRVDFEGTPAVAPVAEGAPADGHGALPDPDRLGLGDRVGLSSSPPLGKVSYPSLWPGISLTYESFEGGIAKSTYFVDPGARVEDIHLRYNVPVEQAGDGSLIFAFETGEMRESAPVAWQEIEGERVEVEVAFRLLGGREVGFAVGPYDGRYPLVVDPGLACNTFLGGSGADDGQAIAVDASGNIYIAGFSTANWGSPVRAYTSGLDVFAAKLNSSGGLTWNTFLGGSGEDYTLGAALDDRDDFYISGMSAAT